MTGLKNFALDTSIYFSTNLLSESTIYNVQTVNLPGVEFSNIQEPTRFGTALKIQADTVNFNPLAVSLVLDENFNVWSDVMKIANDMVKIDEFFQSVENDGTILITNSMGKGVIAVTFHNLKIASIGDLAYSASNENELMLLDVTFDYDKFEYFRYDEIHTLPMINKFSTVLSDAVFDTDGKFINIETKVLA